MRSIIINLPLTTSSTKYYLPVPFPCRVVGMTVVPNVAEATGSIQVGKAGAARSIKTATFAALAAGAALKAVDTAAVTDAEKGQVFDPSVPLELILIGASAGNVGIALRLDETCVGSAIGG